MKKLISVFLLCVIALTAFSACGEKEYDIDKEALAAALVDGGCFKDIMSQIPEQMLRYSYTVADNVSAVLYRGTNATAEEVTVFEAPDAAAAKAVLDIAKSQVETLAKTYDSYNATEAARLRDAIILQKGKYVIVCVCNDKAKAESVIKEHCK